MLGPVSAQNWTVPLRMARHSLSEKDASFGPVEALVRNKCARSADLPKKSLRADICVCGFLSELWAGFVFRMK